MDKTHTAGETEPSGLMSRMVQAFSHIRLSIRSKILLAFLAVLLMLGTLNALFIIRSLELNREYVGLLANITIANDINENFKPAIDTAMWNIVAGKTEFSEGTQYDILADMDAKIHQMIANTDSEKGKIKLDIILRTLETLKHYVGLMGVQIAQDMTVADNERVLENIRGVSDLVQDSIQEYVIFEVKRTEQKYLETQSNFSQWVFTNLLVMGGVILFAIWAAWLISASVYLPIKKLHDMTTTITEQDLAVLVTGDNADEITELSRSFNVMISRVRQLLDEKIEEQQQLKKAEFKTLQAQINPHFLYNTLDTIIWKTEANQKGEVIELVQALSSFFRITLSKGQDWITIHDEVEHVRSYLCIQGMRYRDILTYSLDVEDDILSYTILKLMLQPLVENALYHGIKNKRGGGVITVRGHRLDEKRALFEVEDTGIGIPPNELARLRANLADSSRRDDIGEHGFGIYNVHQRIKLYYGKQFGLSIESELQRGTTVSLVIPLER
ncbi:MAG: sensor histidine kinase [Anaerolineae bacterium]|jgi:two-component system sensor histidine kinase YesM|nr:sensor histidine kinase [Anaerolineae bacterium]